MNRISRVALILFACFVSVAWGQQPAGTCVNNWSEFHRTNMQRWNPCEKVLNVNNVGKLRLKWSYTPLVPIVFSSPAVADGVVYIGDDFSKLYALDATTGAELWEHCCAGEFSAPAVAGGVVYVGAGERDGVRAERQDRRQSVELCHWRPD